MRRSNVLSQAALALMAIGWTGAFMGPEQADARQSREMACASENGDWKRCDLKGADRMNVKLVKQQSKSECKKDYTWGADSDGIWVDKGCRAVFSYSSASGGGGASLGGALFSPGKGIVCDRTAGFCADNQGISMGYTKEYLGQGAQDKMMKRVDDAGGNYDTSWWTFSNGVECKVAKKACYTSKGGTEIDKATTNALFR